MITADIEYFVSVVVHHEGEGLHGWLTVARRADGRFWESKLYVRPGLWVATEQPATPKNGGFFDMSDQDFLFHVRAVIREIERVRFDFETDDFAPLSAKVVDYGGNRRRTLH